VTAHSEDAFRHKDARRHEGFDRRLVPLEGPIRKDIQDDAKDEWQYSKKPPWERDQLSERQQKVQCNGEEDGDQEAYGWQKSLLLKSSDSRLSWLTPNTEAHCTPYRASARSPIGRLRNFPCARATVTCS